MYSVLYYTCVDVLAQSVSEVGNVNPQVRFILEAVDLNVKVRVRCVRIMCSACSVYVHEV